VGQPEDGVGGGVVGGGVGFGVGLGVGLGVGGGVGLGVGRGVGLGVEGACAHSVGGARWVRGRMEREWDGRRGGGHQVLTELRGNLLPSPWADNIH
jgi:hypothetical protein